MMKSEHAKDIAAFGEWEPKIIAFFCNWCSYKAADLAGVSRMKYAPNVHIIRLICSGRIDPQFVLNAFSKGADGVLISGCHPGDCHYIEGNYKAMRRDRLLRRMLKDMGIEEGRLYLEWISASESEKVQWAMNNIIKKVRILGPLNLPENFEKWDREIHRVNVEMTKEVMGTGC